MIIKLQNTTRLLFDTTFRGKIPILLAENSSAMCRRTSEKPENGSDFVWLSFDATSSITILAASRVINHSNSARKIS